MPWEKYRMSRGIIICGHNRGGLHQPNKYKKSCPNLYRHLPDKLGQDFLDIQ